VQAVLIVDCPDCKMRHRLEVTIDSVRSIKTRAFEEQLENYLDHEAG
jgi:hypothetical protein